MTYLITNTSGSTTYQVNDYLSDTADIDLTLIGKGFVSYGSALNTNFLKLLENFANTTSPTKPVTGQLWYDTQNALLKVYSGSSFLTVITGTGASDLTIGGLRLYNGNIIGQSTNANVNIIPNGTGYTIANKFSIAGINTGKLLYTAANGTIQSTSASYTFTGDTLSATTFSGTNINGTTASFNNITATDSFSSTGNIVASSTTNSTNTTSGSLVVKGGVGIASDLYVGGTIYGSVNGGISVNSINNTPIGNAIPTTGGFTVLTVNKNDAAIAIINGGSNGVGDIGSLSRTFNTVFAKANSAQYADLAENYESDQNYDPGTVVEFGGKFEITEGKDNSTRLAGVISSNPAYLMNSHAKGKFILPVALVGRVPCKVIGPVTKGDMMVSAGDGYAIARNNPTVGTVVGRALENLVGGIGIIEVVVGRC